jgi:phage gpG-like protein
VLVEAPEAAVKRDFIRHGPAPKKLKKLKKRRGKAKVGKVQYILTKRVQIPARPFIGFGERLINKLVAAVGDYYGVPKEGTT